MRLNRIADRRYDAENPRTRDRHLPAGRVGIGEAWGFALATAGLLVFAAWKLNPLAFALSPVALASWQQFVTQVSESLLRSKHSGNSN